MTWTGEVNQRYEARVGFPARPYEPVFVNEKKSFRNGISSRAESPTL